MKFGFWIGSLAVVAIALMTSVASAGLNTATYVSIDGSGSGAVEGDITGVGELTILDADGGDMWNDGDNFQYVHDSELITGSFRATVRVVSQTEAIDGRWGKAGIRASSSLDGDASNAMAQIAAGNGSQVDPPTSGASHDPVPARLAGRQAIGGINPNNSGYENPIKDAMGNDVPNNVFASAGTNVSWLSLSYDAGTNAFVAGIAPDVGGAPGAWSFSDPKTDVEATGNGWIVGLAYSAHGDLNFDQVTRLDNLHGVTYDNYSLVPEPSSCVLICLGLMGLIGLRRRNR